MFDENKHPRDNGGKFTSSDGAGGTHEATDAEERRMKELGITNSDGKDRKAQANDSDKTTIKEQVKAGMEKLKDTKVLAVIPKGKIATDFQTATTTLKAELEKSGGVVSRKGFGIIQISSRLKQAGVYIKTAAEIAAVSAVPEIIKNGVLIGVHESHKGREYPSYTFAGKVSVGGQEGILAAVVKKTTGNFYKVHRVLTPECKDLIIEKDTD